jgi:hypothetical protein
MATLPCRKKERAILEGYWNEKKAFIRKILAVHSLPYHPLRLSKNTIAIVVTPSIGKEGANGGLDGSGHHSNDALLAILGL